MGHRRVVDAGRGRGARIRLVRVRERRAGCRRRATATASARATPRTSSCTRSTGSTHHRLSIEWARIEPEEGRRDDGRDRALPRDADRGARRRRRRRGSACTTSRCRAGSPRSATAASSTTAPARTTGPRHVAFCAETFGDLVFGWKPINEPGARSYRRAIYSADRLRRVSTCSARVLLAQRDAWRELRGGGEAGRDDPQPVADLRTRRTRCRPTRCAAALEEMMWDVWMRADRDGVLELPGPRRARGPRPARSVRPRRLLVLQRRPASTAEGKIVPYPSGARVGPMGYAPWSEGLGIVLHRLHEELPGRPLLICEHGVGTDDDEWRCDVLRESLQRRRGRDRRRHRPARLLPLDRRRQLRVEPRLRRAVRLLHRDREPEAAPSSVRELAERCATHR